MLSLLFAISFKFSRSSKKVVINSFCYFLFLNYVKILPKTGLRFLGTGSVFLVKQLQK